MIRLTFLLRMKAGMERDAFYDYWRNTHGPLVASFADKLNILRYVQVHTLWDDAAVAAHQAMAEARGGMEAPYDGVAELWFESRSELLAALEDPAGQEAGAALAADEARFIDLKASPLWLNYEYPQVNPTPENLVARPRSDLVKLYFPLRMRRSVDLPWARDYWRHQHGPLIRRQAAGSGIQRYVQVHRTEDEIETGLRVARGTEAPAYDGHAEVWFNRSQMSLSTPERVAAARRAVEDEANFIDFERSTMWLAKEHVIIDRF